MTNYTLQFEKEDALAVRCLSTDNSLTLITGAFADDSNTLLVIDFDNVKAEVIRGAISGTTITIAARGLDGTSAVDHDADAPIAICFTPSHYEAVKENGIRRFWASLFITGCDLTTKATTTLTANPGYTVTKIEGNSAGLSATAGKRKIMGGFYFSAPRTGLYRLRFSGNHRCSGGTGPYGMWTFITNDTSNPTQNADGADDTGTIIRTTTACMAGGAYDDTLPLADEVIVSLTAGTTYYFTIQNKWASNAGTTPSGVQVGGDQGATQGLTFSIEELPSA